MPLNRKQVLAILILITLLAIAVLIKIGT